MSIDSRTETQSTLFQPTPPIHYHRILETFDGIARSFIRLNLLFLFLITIELSLSSLLFLSFSQSSLLTVSIGLFFITLFAYPVLLFYFQAKKPEQFSALLTQFVDSSRTLLKNSLQEPHPDLSIAQTLFSLAKHLDFKEELFTKIPSFFKPLLSLLTHFSTRCYFYDFFQFKELLLQNAIEYHVCQVRQTPIDLEVHASLATVYVALSKIYQAPKETESLYSIRSKFYRKQRAIFTEQFEIAVKLALEEFQILSQFAPNDPWIHEQLSAGYRDLGLYLDEIREVETLLELKPQDREILFRLGALYFRQGLNAKGLQVYQKLQQSNYSKADLLIRSYGITSK